jgi:hypothetical protein
LLWALAAIVSAAHAQTSIDLRTQTKAVDFTGAAYTRPAKAGAALPSSCAQGEVFFLTTAAPGKNLYLCSAVNSWATLAPSVDLPSLNGSAGKLLFTDGSAALWRALAGDVSGAPDSLRVTGLQGFAVGTSTPSDGQALRWNGPAGQWQPASDTLGSIFGRTGAVTAQTGDYLFSQIAGTAAISQGGTGANSASQALSNLGAAALVHQHTWTDLSGVTGKHGNGSTVQMFGTGTVNTNDCAQFDSTGSLVSSGGPCGASSGLPDTGGQANLLLSTDGATANWRTIGAGLQLSNASLSMDGSVVGLLGGTNLWTNQQTFQNGHIVIGSTSFVDHSGAGYTAPLRTVSSLPASCQTNIELIINLADGVVYKCNTTGTAWTAVNGAPINGYFLVTQSANAPVNSFNLGALASGLLKCSVSGGVCNPGRALPGTDYIAPTAGSGVQKADGAGGLTAATPGTDFSAPASAEITSGNRLFTGTVDASGASATLPIRVAAGATATVNGAMAYNTTDGMIHAAQGNADAFLVQSTASPTDGDCMKWVVVGSQIKAGTAGSGCGSGGGGGGGAGGGISMWSPSAPVSLAGTLYAGIGGALQNASETAVAVKSPGAMSARSLQVTLDAAPGTGNSLAVTLRAGGSDTALTCTISNSSTTCQDVTHVVAISPNDLLSYKFVISGAIGSTRTPSIMVQLGTGVQDPGSSGLVVRTALNTTIPRTLQGTAGHILIANGDGVAANPTIDIPSGVSLPAPSLGSTSMTSTYTNDTTTGTVTGKTVKLTGVPSKVILPATSDTGGIIGICAGGCGVSGVSEISIRGQASCTFDGSTTAGDYVQLSSTVAGDCHDAGAVRPTSGQILGRVLSTNSGTGTYTIDQYGDEIQGATPTTTFYNQQLIGAAGQGIGANNTNRTQRTVLQGRDNLTFDDDGTNTILNWTPVDARIVPIDEEFFTNNTSSGTIGTYGWATGGVAGTNTLSQISSSTWPNLGVLVMTAGSGSPAAGNGNYVALGGANAGILGSLANNSNWTYQWIFSVGTATSVRFRCGVTASSPGASIDPNSTFGVRADTNLGDTDFMLYVKSSGGVITTIDTGVSIDTTFHTAQWYATAAGTLHAIFDSGADVTFCSSGCTATATLTTNNLAPFAQCVTDTNSSRTCNLDAFKFKGRVSTNLNNRRN